MARTKFRAVFWVEYRQKVGLDNSVYPGETFGLLVEMEDDPENSGRMNSSDLLDMTPATYGQTAEVQALTVGQTWTNPVRDTKPTLLSASPTEAVVSVGSRHVRVPDVRGLSLNRAKEVLAEHRLTGFGGANVTDPNCTYIGVVATQSSFPGDRVFEGTWVNLGIGVEDPRRRCR